MPTRRKPQPELPMDEDATEFDRAAARALLWCEFSALAVMRDMTTAKGADTLPRTLERAAQLRTIADATAAIRQLRDLYGTPPAEDEE